MRGRTASAPRIAPQKRTSIARRESSSRIVSAGPTWMMPALFTRRSMGPTFSSTSATSPAMPSSSVTSQGRATASMPSAARPARARSSSPSSRAQITTRMPRRPSSRARTRPSPREPPVTSATRRASARRPSRGRAPTPPPRAPPPARPPLAARAPPTEGWPRGPARATAERPPASRGLFGWGVSGFASRTSRRRHGAPRAPEPARCEVRRARPGVRAQRVLRARRFRTFSDRGQARRKNQRARQTFQPGGPRCPSSDEVPGGGIEPPTRGFSGRVQEWPRPRDPDGRRRPRRGAVAQLKQRHGASATLRATAARRLRRG